MNQFTQFLVPLPDRTPDNRHHTLHIRVEQAFAQNTLPDHARRAEDNNVHALLSGVGGLRFFYVDARALLNIVDDAGMVQISFALIHERDQHLLDQAG